MWKGLRDQKKIHKVLIQMIYKNLKVNIVMSVVAYSTLSSTTKRVKRAPARPTTGSPF